MTTTQIMKAFIEAKARAEFCFALVTLGNPDDRAIIQDTLQHLVDAMNHCMNAITLPDEVPLSNKVDL